MFEQIVGVQLWLRIVTLVHTERKTFLKSVCFSVCFCVVLFCIVCFVCSCFLAKSLTDHCKVLGLLYSLSCLLLKGIKCCCSDYTQRLTHAIGLFLNV